MRMGSSRNASRTAPAENLEEKTAKVPKYFIEHGFLGTIRSIKAPPVQGACAPILSSTGRVQPWCWDVFN